MNKRLALAFGVALLTAGAGFLACGGDDASSPNGSGNDGSADSTANGDSGSTGDTGSAADGGTQANPDPGKVTCGNTTCNVPEQFCCIHPDASIQTCDDAGPGVGPGTCGNGSQIYCDESADCPDAGVNDPQVCCVQLTVRPPRGGMTYNNNCRAALSCGGRTNRVACKNDEECASTDAGRCVAQACNGRVIHTCGPLATNDAGVPVGCN